MGLPYALVDLWWPMDIPLAWQISFTLPCNYWYMTYESSCLFFINVVCSLHVRTIVICSNAYSQTVTFRCFARISLWITMKELEAFICWSTAFHVAQQLYSSLSIIDPRHCDPEIWNDTLLTVCDPSTWVYYHAPVHLVSCPETGWNLSHCLRSKRGIFAR